MIEMVFFVFGVYTLVFGRIHLPGNFDLEGWRARIAGLLIMAPFPLTLVLGRQIGSGLRPEQGQSVFGLLELALVVAGVGAAALFAWLTKPKGQPADEELPDEQGAQ